MVGSDGDLRRLRLLLRLLVVRRVERFLVIVPGYGMSAGSVGWQHTSDTIINRRRLVRDLARQVFGLCDPTLDLGLRG